MPKTFKRIIIEQLHQALLLTARITREPDFITHEIRKTTKRTRAVYRLFRQTAGEELYRRGNEFHMNLSQHLASFRISRVYIDTLQLLKKDKKLQAISMYIEELIRVAENRHRMLTLKLLNEEHLENSLTDLLSAEMKTIRKLPDLSCDYRKLASGLKRTYGRGRNWVKTVIEKSSTEDLHNLRKAVKALWNQYILLRPVWPSYIGTEIHQLDLLAQKLGQEHDLADLEQLIRAEGVGTEEHQQKTVLEFIARKRSQLQRAIRPMALRLFADKPVSIGRRIKLYYGLYLNRPHKSPLQKPSPDRP